MRVYIYIRFIIKGDLMEFYKNLKFKDEVLKYI